jgi:hypothetical protein
MAHASSRRGAGRAGGCAGALAAIFPPATLDLRLLLCDLRLQILRSRSRLPRQRFIDDLEVIATHDGADGKLRLIRRAQLSRDHDVEGRIERLGDLRSDDNAATRDTEDEEPVPMVASLS